MQSSSFFLRSSTTLITIAACLSSVLAVPTSAIGAAYSLQTTYAGSNFFSGFTFFTDADPTHGFVTYVDESKAQSMGLISAKDGSPVRIGVDHTNKYDGNKNFKDVNGVGRPSVRIASTQKYNHGLFIADIANMPGGVCGTWPALWTLGDNQWPFNGEIDIIEGVHTSKQTLTSLHTGKKCNVPGNSSMQTGSSQGTNCMYDTHTGANSGGCGVLDNDSASFGLPFNTNGGGVFAWEWTSNSIRSWFFRRDAIPADITSGGSPQPATWGTPYVNFQGDCDIDSNFVNHQIVLDTTFCGDWAGNTWGDSCAASTGVSSCSVYVGNNPEVFKDMYWSINSIKVYSTNGNGTSSSPPRSSWNPLSLSTAAATATASAWSWSPMSTLSTSTLTFKPTSASASLWYNIPGTGKPSSSVYTYTYSNSYSYSASAVPTTIATPPTTTPSWQHQTSSAAEWQRYSPSSTAAAAWQHYTPSAASWPSWPRHSHYGAHRRRGGHW